MLSYSCGVVEFNKLQHQRPHETTQISDILAVNNTQYLAAIKTRLLYETYNWKISAKNNISERASLNWNVLNKYCLWMKVAFCYDIYASYSLIDADADISTTYK